MNVNHRITHNGDFDAWRIFGDAIAYNDVTVYSMSAGRELLKSELMPRQIPMADNPYIKPHPNEAGDPVERDI